jgi:hypothetical protein
VHHGSTSNDPQASSKLPEDPGEFFTRFGATTFQQGPDAVPELVMFYDLLQRYCKHAQPKSAVWFAPLSAEACRHHCLFTTVACGYTSLLCTDFCANDSDEADKLLNAYEKAQEKIGKICESEALSSYSHAHKAMVQIHLAAHASLVNAVSYSKTAPLFEEHRGKTDVAEVRNHCQPDVGQGLYALQALEKEQQVCRYLGACAYA